MISICILNWNCIDVVKKTISLLSEDLTELEHEIIIFDQNSTDDSKNFLNSLNRDNITVILSDKNVGNSISRNIMIKKSKYKYVLLLDSDIIPIKNSLKCMVDFMEKNTNCGFLGYDYKSYTQDITQITPFENGIEDKDVIIWRDKVALSQYGLFRKSLLENFSFPEFYPFNQSGWGAEDDALGWVIYKSGSKAGTIMNRIYYHEKSSSIPLLGQDNFQMMYMRRIIHFFYFKFTLSYQDQLLAIKNKTLPTTKLKCNKYSWRIQNNIGDVAIDWMLSEFFPFLEFDETNKTNLLIFGGTVLNHIDNANFKYQANYKNILFFGVGASCANEIIDAKSMIDKNKINYSLIARGQKSQSEFKNHGLRCQEACGDVLQLFSALPIIETKEEDPELVIMDPYIRDQVGFITSKDTIFVKVANDGRRKDVPFYGLQQYLKLLENVSKVYSSQIHPTFISSTLGKPSKFYTKDWRIEDFKYFKSFSEDMTIKNSLDFRLDCQRNILRFSELFFNNIKMFL